MEGGGRLSPRALERITVASTVRHSAAMTKSSDTPFAGSAYDRLDYDSLDEDTIEIVLSPEDMQSLSRAADEALAEAKATRALAASLIASLTPIEGPATTETRVAPKTPVPTRMPAATATGAPAATRSLGAIAAPPATKLLAATAVPPTIKPPAASATIPVINPPAVSGALPMTKSPAASTVPPTIKPPAATAMLAATQSPSATSAPPPTEIPSATRASATTQAPMAAESRTPKVNAAAHRAIPTLRVAGIIGVVAVTAVALAGIAHHTKEAAAAEPVLASTAASSTHLITPVPTIQPPEAVATPDPVAAPNPTEPEPVRVKNPFDHSEVFEFPAGTSLKEARQSVAEILMQRAHQRGIQPSRPSRADRHPVARSKPPEPDGLVQTSTRGAR